MLLFCLNKRVYNVVAVNLAIWHIRCLDTVHKTKWLNLQKLSKSYVYFDTLHCVLLLGWSITFFFFFWWSPLLVLSINQSGFHKKHSTTAVLKVLNYIVESIDNGDFCVSLFINLSKTFDTVNHEILLHRLKRVGLSSHVIPWFKII